VNDLAPIPVVVPLAGAAVVLFTHAFVPRSVVRVVSGAAVVAEIVLAAILLHEARASTIVYWFGGWTPRAGIALGISFTVDQLGAAAAVLAGIVVAAAMTTIATLDGGDGIVHALLLTLLAAMAGFCLTGDLFNLFVFFELMAVSAFGLAAYHTRSLPALRGALNFAIANSIGAFLFLVGIALLYGRTGALNLAQIGRYLASHGGLDRLAVVALALIVVGLLVKAAVVPFHFWLVDTATSAPLPLVVVLAGVLDTLGIYGIARVYWTAFAMPAGTPALRTVLVAIGAITAGLAGVLSLAFRDPRRRLAFVMVAHTGIILIGVGCLTAHGLAASAVYAAGDGLVKAVLFLGVALLGWQAAGTAARRAGVAFLAVGGLALAGLPLFATGLGQAAIEDAVSRVGAAWVTPVIVITAALTGAAVIRLAVEGNAGGVAGDGPGRGWWSVPLAMGVVLLGLSAAVTLAGNWAVRAATRFAATAAYQQQILTGHAPPLPGGGFHLALPASGVAPDLTAVVLAVVLGSGVVTPAARRLARTGPVATGWRAARRLHDGSIGDAATWTTIGTAAIALALASGAR
jgi:multicomponent Na+:H+ antiporter subunit D